MTEWLCVVVVAATTTAESHVYMNMARAWKNALKERKKPFYFIQKKKTENKRKMMFM